MLVVLLVYAACGLVALIVATILLRAAAADDHAMELARELHEMTLPR